MSQQSDVVKAFVTSYGPEPEKKEEEEKEEERLNIEKKKQDMINENKSDGIKVQEAVENIRNIN